MKIKIPSTGREVDVGCRHEYVGYPGTVSCGKKSHVTTAWIMVAETLEVLAVAFATCSAKDNFCRKTGRKLATERLLADIRKKDVEAMRRTTHEGFYIAPTKEDRRAVFQALCPEFFKAKPAIMEA